MCLRPEQWIWSESGSQTSPHRRSHQCRPHLSRSRALCPLRRHRSPPPRRPADVIMLLLPNFAEFVLTFLGASMIGAVSTTANAFYTASEVQKQAAAAGVKLVITESCHVKKVWDIGATIVGIDEPTPEGCLPFSKVVGEGDERPSTSSPNKKAAGDAGGGVAA